MNMITRMWLMGFAAGVFLMAAIQALGQVLDGGGALAWIQLVGGSVVVVASVAVLLQARKADSGGS